MDINKLHSVVDAGFRSALRGALVSEMYPHLTQEVMAVDSVVLTAADLKEVLILVDTDEVVLVTPPTITSGVLETLGPPPDGLPMIDDMRITSVAITSGSLTDVVKTYIPDDERAIVTPVTLVEGTLTVVVVATEFGDTTTVSPVNITTGILA